MAKDADSTEFERAVAEHLQITSSIAKIASQRLLEEITLKGALERVRLELAGVRLRTIELNPPFFQAMLNRNRLDLSLEAFVLRAEWRPLFSEQQLHVARRRLNEHGYAPEMQGRLPSLDLPPARPPNCLLTRTAKPIYFSMLEEALPNQLRRIEDSL